MPPIVAAAAITGIAAVGSQVAASRSQSSANKRAISASATAAQRAEAFTREQDAANRADDARQDAEDARRWEVEQANVARQQQQEDALLKDNLARSSYEDAIRYGKMVNLARLTGQPIPERPPARTAGDLLNQPTVANLSKVPTSAPLMSRPSTANQMIAQPGQMEPFAAQNQRLPISNLVGRRRVV